MFNFAEWEILDYWNFEQCAFKQQTFETWEVPDSAHKKASDVSLTTLMEMKFLSSSEPLLSVCAIKIWNSLGFKQKQLKNILKVKNNLELCE